METVRVCDEHASSWLDPFRHYYPHFAIMGNTGTMMSKSVEDHKTKGASSLCVDTGKGSEDGSFAPLTRVDSTDSPKILGTLNISHWMQQELIHDVQRDCSSPGAADRPPTRNTSHLDLSSLCAEPKPALVEPKGVVPNSVSPCTLVRRLAILEENNEQSEVADVEQVAADNTRAQGQGPPTPVKSIFTSAVAKSR